MFVGNTGLYALGVSGNVWLLPERADSGTCAPEASCDSGSTVIPLDDPVLAENACRLESRVPLPSAMMMPSSRSGLGGLGELDRLWKPPPVNADEIAALSGKEGSREM